MARKFHLYMRKSFFTGTGCPERVESLSVEIVKSCLDGILCNLLQVTLLAQGGDDPLWSLAA